MIIGEAYKTEKYHAREIIQSEYTNSRADIEAHIKRSMLANMNNELLKYGDTFTVNVQFSTEEVRKDAVDQFGRKGDLIRRAYDEAIREQYRFYSYGDAMLIV